MAKEDLVPFKKGKDPRRNVTGKNKGAFSLVNMLKAEIQKCPEGQDKKTYADLIIKRMMDDSVKKGDIQHIKTIWAYLEGMPKQTVDGSFKIEKQIYDGQSVQRHNSDTQDIQSEEEDKSGSGGDECKQDD